MYGGSCRVKQNTNDEQCSTEGIPRKTIRVRGDIKYYLPDSTCMLFGETNGLLDILRPVHLHTKQVQTTLGTNNIWPFDTSGVASLYS